GCFETERDVVRGTVSNLIRRGAATQARSRPPRDRGRSPLVYHCGIPNCTLLLVAQRRQPCRRLPGPVPVPPPLPVSHSPSAMATAPACGRLACHFDPAGPAPPHSPPSDYTEHHQQERAMRHTFRPQIPRGGPLTICMALGIALMLLAPPAGAESAGGAPRGATAVRLSAAIVGHVTDSTSRSPVAGATVLVNGTRLGAVTDSAGYYRIANVPAGAQTIVVHRVGYAPGRRTVTVGADGDVTVDFVLLPSITSLSEVIVTGTAGGQLRRELGNAVGEVSAPTVLSKSQAPDLGSLLNSRVPGVSIVPNSGRLGAGPNINIRGVSSLSLDNNPLIYIDGVRVSNRTGGGPTRFGNGGFGSQNAGVVGRLNDINPEEIESIQIIKGPAAATIYGTEAANGVIQIITKQGASGKPVLNVQVQQGGIYFRDPEGRVQTNYVRDGTGTIVPFNAIRAQDDSGTPVFTTGKSNQYSASLAGGLGLGRYFLSANYQDDHGVEPNNSIRQFGAHANL